MTDTKAIEKAIEKGFIKGSLKATAGALILYACIAGVIWMKSKNDSDLKCEVSE